MEGNGVLWIASHIKTAEIHRRPPISAHLQIVYKSPHTRGANAGQLIQFSGVDVFLARPCFFLSFFSSSIKESTSVNWW